ncbi:MAG TPA: ester cyclase [Solirubrobacteraceae bacterium]|nr:ester cyclase [Solirubrobacteraceae bacterium]
MASSSETVRAYFSALSEHDLDAAVALWRPGGIDAISGQGELVAPEGIRGFFAQLFAAFPDWRFEILETTTQRGRCAVRWRARATFAGPGRLQGFIANGERIDLEGCDVLTVEDDLIVANHAYLDRVDLLQQLELLPRPGSPSERGLARVTNVASARRRSLAGGEAKVIAPGVWLVSAKLPSSMNVYLIAEPDGGVTVFDAGIRSMAPAIAAAGARLGGIRRVILGHADSDHRGAAPALGAPVYVHPADAEAAGASANRRDYWDLAKLSPLARPLFPILFRIWDGGAVPVAGTIEEGDTVAGFRVLHLPGHAPGLIALLREEDGLVLCSDVVYTLNAETGIAGTPRTPHPAFNWNTEQARASLRRLAEFEPRVVWPGHAKPVSGPGVAAQLLAAAEV